MRDKILSLLASGTPAALVASVCSVTPGYVSQLLAEERFSQELMALKVAQLQNATTRDGKYDSMEDTLLDKLEQAVPFMMKPREILGALKVVNDAKRRGAQVQAGDLDASAQQHVHLHLPATIVNQFVLNGQSEVVEVAGRSLETMTAKTLRATLGKRVPEQLEHLPAAPTAASSKQPVSLADL